MALLTLELLDGSNPSARQSGLQLEDLGIVWRDDEDVGEVNGKSIPSRFIQVGSRTLSV